jgi:hypothetical protein
MKVSRDLKPYALTALTMIGVVAWIFLIGKLILKPCYPQRQRKKVNDV